MTVLARIPPQAQPAAVQEEEEEARPPLRGCVTERKHYARNFATTAVDCQSATRSRHLFHALFTQLLPPAQETTSPGPFQQQTGEMRKGGQL